MAIRGITASRGTPAPGLRRRRSPLIPHAIGASAWRDPRWRGVLAAYTRTIRCQRHGHLNPELVPRRRSGQRANRDPQSLRPPNNPSPFPHVPGPRGRVRVSGTASGSRGTAVDADVISGVWQRSPPRAARARRRSRDRARHPRLCGRHQPRSSRSCSAPSGCRSRGRSRRRRAAASSADRRGCRRPFPPGPSPRRSSPR